jgi:threonine dehydratase
MISVLDILAARRRLVPYLRDTPLQPSDWLSAATGARVHLKLESLHLTNSFKIRGAFNAALRIVETAGTAKAPKIVTASAGNHGRALALAAERLGLEAVVFTPRTAPATKKAAIRYHGAKLRDESPDFDAAEHAAQAFTSREGALYVSPYNHADVIAGAGTVALEILDVLPRFDVLIAPLGGGGLVSGVGTVLKAAAPHVRVIGVETSASTPFAASLAAGHIVQIPVKASLADGLTGNLEPGAVTYEIVRRVVDQLEAVDEGEIATAISSLAAEEHLIVEGAGAVASAAVLAKRVIRPGETGVVLVTGGNIDVVKLAELLR